MLSLLTISMEFNTSIANTDPVVFPSQASLVVALTVHECGTQQILGHVAHLILTIADEAVTPLHIM